jgi:hypothetical protein
MRYKTSSKKRIVPLETPCRKALYHTREDAEDMIRHLAETRRGREISAYRCDVCGFWHLTSREK